MSLRRAVSRAVAGLRSSLPAAGASKHVRMLHLHEYCSKDLMRKYGVRVQKGMMAEGPEKAREISQKLLDEGAPELVVKAQILAGGRGRGHFNTGFKGGVKICLTPDEVVENTKAMLGHNLITHQTGPEGQPVSKVLVHESISFDRELYFAILLDRSFDGPVVVVSPMGGMDIEQVALDHPDKIFTEPVDLDMGLTDAQTERIGKLLGFEDDGLKEAATQFKNLYKLFVSTDATQVEINPLVQVPDGRVYCVDAKINFDDNAAFRQKDIFALRDHSMEDPREVEASKHALNYIGLDGNIGCMANDIDPEILIGFEHDHDIGIVVNGAGLAMATMDIIKLYGGAPANFLDVGGSANEKQVAEAFKILNNDHKVKAILVNIFGGIMKCDVIAEGIVAAGKTVKLNVPLVVRLEGTNVERGREILENSDIKVITADTLDDAALKAVEAI